MGWALKSNQKLGGKGKGKRMKKQVKELPYIAGHSTPPMYSTPLTKFTRILKYPDTIHGEFQF